MNDVEIEMQEVLKKIKSVQALLDKVHDELNDIDLNNEMKKSYSDEAIRVCVETENKFWDHIYEATSAIKYVKEEIYNQYGTTGENGLI